MVYQKHTKWEESQQTRKEKQDEVTNKGTTYAKLAKQDVTNNTKGLLEAKGSAGSKLYEAQKEKQQLQA